MYSNLCLCFLCSVAAPNGRLSYEIYQGVFLVFEYFGKTYSIQRLPRFNQIAVTFAIVCSGGFFRAPGLSQAMHY
jgi:hypothetical protein